jgi:hypothetical protein
VRARPNNKQKEEIPTASERASFLLEDMTWDGRASFLLEDRRVTGKKNKRSSIPAMRAL